MAKVANTNRRTKRGKARPKRSVALRSSSAALRKKRGDGDLAATRFVGPKPATEMYQSMSGIMNAYIELPARLMQCRTPLGVLREQALFAGRLFDLIERGFHQAGES